MNIDEMLDRLIRGETVESVISMTDHLSLSPRHGLSSDSYSERIDRLNIQLESIRGSESHVIIRNILFPVLSEWYGLDSIESAIDQVNSITGQPTAESVLSAVSKLVSRAHDGTSYNVRRLVGEDHIPPHLEMPEYPHTAEALQDLRTRLGKVLPELHFAVTSMPACGEKSVAIDIFNEVNTAHEDLGNLLSNATQSPTAEQYSDALAHYESLVSSLLAGLDPSPFKTVGAPGPYVKMGGRVTESVVEGSVRKSDILKSHGWNSDGSGRWTHPNHPGHQLSVGKNRFTHLFNGSYTHDKTRGADGYSTYNKDVKKLGDHLSFFHGRKTDSVRESSMEHGLTRRSRIIARVKGEPTTLDKFKAAPHGLTRGSKIIGRVTGKDTKVDIVKSAVRKMLGRESVHEDEYHKVLTARGFKRIGSRKDKSTAAHFYRSPDADVELGTDAPTRGIMAKYGDKYPKKSDRHVDVRYPGGSSWGRMTPKDVDDTLDRLSRTRAQATDKFSRFKKESVDEMIDSVIEAGAHAKWFDKKGAGKSLTFFAPQSRAIRAASDTGRKYKDLPKSTQSAIKAGFKTYVNTPPGAPSRGSGSFSNYAFSDTYRQRKRKLDK